MWSTSERLKKCFQWLLCGFVFFSSYNAYADYRLGAGIGYGGVGIASKTNIENTSIDVSRSDGPLVGSFLYEQLTSDSSSYSIDHSRGILLSPFSSGVGFTGVSWRWYFWGKAPSVAKISESASYLIVTRRVFHSSLCFGLANGAIERGGDAIPTVSGSGTYYGGRAGYDIQTDPDRIFRVEAFYAKTLNPSGFVTATLSLFSIQAVWLFLY